MTALAVIAGLVAAMFVAYTPARAAVGDVSAANGWCLLNTGVTPNAHQLSSDRDSFTALTVLVPDTDTTDAETGDDAVTDPANIACSAANVNMAVSVTPNGSRFPALTYNTHEVVVSFGASPRAGTTTTISAYVKNPLAGASYTAPAAALLATVSPANSGAAITDSASGDVAADGAISIDPAVPTQIRSLTLLSTASGEFLVTVNALYDTGAKNVNGTKSVTVGETAAVADTKVASATLALDYVTYDTPTTTENEAVRESDTKPAGASNNIWLKLTIDNSLGNLAENTDLDSVTVFAPNATLGLFAANAAGTQRTATQIGTDGLHVVSRSETDTPGTEEVTKTMYVRISSTSPIQTSVYAQINGKVRSNSVDLTFTGPAASIEVSEASKTLSSKSGDAEGAGITFTVTAKDAADNEGVALLINQVNLRVLDADGKRVASNPTAAKAQGKKADGSADNTKVIVTITTSATKAAASGEYTLEATLGSNQKTTQTVTFNVAGPPANIELSADPESADEPGLVTLTAVVNDEAGVSVADGTMVKFSALGGGAALITAADVATKDGKATATLGVTGPGTTIVYATSGEAADDLNFVSTAGAVEPEAPAAVAASVTLADVDAELSHGDSVTVTATVTDADGNAVPNGTHVTFSLAGGGTLFSPRTVGTVDGTASADIVNLTDDIWVRAFSGTASSASMRISVESAGEQADREADEAEAQRVADAEQAAADAADDAAAEAEKASDAADAAAAADSPEDAQSAADDAAAAATAAQTAADAAQEAADDAGTDAAQESADAAQESADAAQASADAAQKSADDAKAAADAAAQADADAEAQAEADRQAEIAAGVEAALEAQVDEVSLDCLSALNGFSTWTCNVDTTASALFGMLAERGATAVHLWNGSMWVRYAVVDGSEIPGSSDFTVTEDDILYISN